MMQERMNNPGESLDLTRNPSGDGRITRVTAISRDSSGTSIGEWEQPRRRRWRRKAPGSVTSHPAAVTSTDEGDTGDTGEASPEVLAGAGGAEAAASKGAGKSGGWGLRLKQRVVRPSAFATANAEAAAAAAARQQLQTPDSASGLLSNGEASGGSAGSAAAGQPPPQRRRPGWRLEALGRRIRFRRPRRHDEWRRAHERLVGGMNMEVRWRGLGLGFEVGVWVLMRGLVKVGVNP